MIDAISSATGSVAQTLFALANPRAVGSLGSNTAHGSIKAVESAESVKPAENSVGETELTEEERAEIEKLKQRDQEVRRHEQAHKAAAGQHARGGPSFEYERGPNGRQYATGGHVDVDTSEVSGDPQATITKMQQVRRAALAPGEPSSADRQIASQAAQKEQRARAELANQKVGGDAEGASAASGTNGAEAVLGEGRPSPTATSGGETDSPTTTAGAAAVLGEGRPHPTATSGGEPEPTSGTQGATAQATVLGAGRRQPTASSGTDTAVHRASGRSTAANHGRPIDQAYSASSVGFIRPGRFINVQA